MGLFSHKISRDELMPADHIYSWRQAYTYAHHGIYVGEGKVIHFTCGGGQEIGAGAFLRRIIASLCPKHSGTPCPDCGDQSNLDGVICSCLDCFLDGGELYRFEYGVSPAFFLAKIRGGTCTLATADPPQHTLHRANFLLQKNGFGDYNVYKNNCENFANYCKTGLVVSTTVSVGQSGQAASALEAVKAVASTQLGIKMTRVGGLAVSWLAVGGLAVEYGKYCARRLDSDIGMRRDVSKVPVERLWEILGARCGGDESDATVDALKNDGSGENGLAKKVS